jgi:hypothetical protein
VRVSLSTLSIVLAASVAVAAPTTRIERSVQRAAAGCWQLGEHDRVVFTAAGEGMRATHRNTSTSPPRELRAVVRYDPVTRELGFRVIGRIHAAMVVMRLDGPAPVATFFSQRDPHAAWRAGSTVAVTRCATAE